ncbi:MAG: hypothetical protein JWM53_6372 [bacterium]|nr:hypothetical protein [bacterium]
MPPETRRRKDLTERDSSDQLATIAADEPLGSADEPLGSADEREFDFPVGYLQSGDPVEVYSWSEREWQRGTFEVTAAGIAVVAVAGRAAFRYDGARLMGVRRTLH